MSNGIEEVVIPASWNGLSRQQLIAYAELLFPYRKKLVTVENGEMYVSDQELFETICFGLLYYFLGIDWELYQRIPAEEIHRLLYREKILHFLWETYELDVNLIDTIETDTHTLYGPTDFAHLSFEEMQLADGYFIDYFNTQSVDALNLFIATLYRKRRKDAEYGDKRIAFDVELIAYQLPCVTNIAKGVKDAVVIWYENQRELLMDNFAECFSSEPSESKQTLVQMMLSIGQGIDNFDLIRKTPAVIVYADIQRVIKENRKLKRNDNNL